MDDAFEILAAKVLAGEASSEEQARLRDLLARSARLREDYAALEATWNVLQKHGPAADALAAAPAPIPEERLKKLQDVVRETLGPADVVTARQAGPARVLREPVSCVLGFWRWWHARTGVPPLAVSVAVLLCILVGVALFLQKPGATHSLGGAPPVAYCLDGDRRAELRRSGRTLPASRAVVLDGDEIRLPSGATMTLFTSNGMVVLRGPVRLSSDALAGRADAPLTTNAAAAELRTALFSPVPQLPGAGLLVATRGGEVIRLYSPLGATANLTPMILWKADPATTYDLLITDEFDASTPPWRANGVAPPVDFARMEAWKDRALAMNGLYRLRLTETGRPLTASEYTFRTLNDPNNQPSRTAEEKLLDAVRIMAYAPARTGDALLDLLSLPPEFADSELALRLKLLTFGQLGYAQEFDATAALLTRLAPPTP